jgi:chromosome segregation ATPase
MKPILPAALLLSLIAPVNHAQDRPTISTKEEFRACLEEGDSLESERNELESAQRRLESAQKDLQALARTHSSRSAGINRRDAKAVDSFNQTSKQIKDLSERLNDQADRMLAKHSEFNAKIFKTNSRCSGMVVKSEDHQAVLLERVLRAVGR